jgi:dihydroorotate dehydrogenase (NAD+) catalytic subunit
MKLEVQLGDLKLKNPVLVASGTFAYGEDLTDFFDPSALGGLMLKGLTLKPRAGNKPPRIAETPAGVLNSIGLENVGVDAFIREKMPRLRGLDTAIIPNLWGEKLEDYVALVEKFRGVDGVAALELNLSCPNVKGGGMFLATTREGVQKVVEACREVAAQPLIAKLTPNVADICALAKGAKEGGATAVSLINTLLGMGIDVKTRRPLLGNVMGGLSGPAIRPIAVRMVYEVARDVKIPIIGMGGIRTLNDALEFFLAGASAVAVGTATLSNPCAALDLLRALEKFGEDEKLGSVTELVGAMRIA